MEDPATITNADKPTNPNEAVPKRDKRTLGCGLRCEERHPSWKPFLSIGNKYGDLQLNDGDPFQEIEHLLDQHRSEDSICGRSASFLLAKLVVTRGLLVPQQHTLTTTNRPAQPSMHACISSKQQCRIMNPSPCHAPNITLLRTSLQHQEADS